MKLYNTLSRQIEKFTPFNDNKVKMFACGPTVYDYAHIGNGRTAITMDVLSRFLRFIDFEVFYLVNITDIDDKIIIRAKEQNISWEELRNKYESQYLKDMDGLGIKIDKFARATDYIDYIKKQVNILLEKGHAYKIDDGIYFEINTYKEYGKLSGRKNIEKNDAISRIDENNQKKGWNDFCLWKFSKEGEPSWQADFGDGRPGWHIEDTAITEHLFGPQYDIHGGGSDLIFPHHEAELTQMESASGKVPFVKYWVHGGLLHINDARMGKSNKNFYTIEEILEKYGSSAIRLFMLQGHYRSTLNFSFELLDSCVNRLSRWQGTADLVWQKSTAKEISKEQLQIAKSSYGSFVDALKNDLDTPNAIVEIEKFIDIIDSYGVSSALVEIFNDYISAINDIFGINLSSSDIDDKFKELIRAREQARNENNWKLSDEIREQLLTSGVVIKDTENGTIWSRQ